MAITGKEGRRCHRRTGLCRERQARSRCAASTRRSRHLWNGPATPEFPGMFFLRNAITLKYIYVYELNALERAAAIGAITHSLEARKLINNVGMTAPLSGVVAAHEAVESGKVPGNVVVEIR